MNIEVFAEKTKAPIDIHLLLGLFKFLDIELEKHGCSHHHKLVVRFLKSQGVQNVETVLQWLRDNGAYCDCEVILCEVILNVPYSIKRMLNINHVESD